MTGDGLVIPLIDFSKFTSGDPSDRLSTAQAILTGFQTVGFIYLSHTPIPSSILSTIFSSSASFFALPQSSKLALAWTTPEANRGYSAPGQEKVTQLNDIDSVNELRSENPDIKESFEIGREGEEGCPNQWPDKTTSPGFREVMTDFHAQCRAIHEQVMCAIAVGMGLSDEHYFDQFVSKGDNTLRLLHYPPVSQEVFKRDPGRVMRAGAHSDYGSITLLFQDSRGGLQVQAPSGKFVDATPIEGTVVVNAGDLLARWSNDTIRSTVHRVVEPPVKGDGEEYPARYSVAYFCNPNHDAYIEVIPGTYETEEEKKYPGIVSGDYLVQRLTATY